MSVVMCRNLMKGSFLVDRISIERHGWLKEYGSLRIAKLLCLSYAVLTLVSVFSIKEDLPYTIGLSSLKFQL